MSLGIVILAAGQGTRMRSALPKVLHPIAGRPMLAHVIATARAMDPARIVVVYGHGGEQVRAAFPDPELQWAEQAEQLGTGHAVQQALPQLAGLERVLVLYGDVPLLRRETLRRLLLAAGDQVGLLTMNLSDPSGYGRVLRAVDGDVTAIVEHKDASDAQRAISEVNTGILVLPGARLPDWLANLSSDNAQGEYYLTDLIAMAVADGVAVNAAQPDDPLEAEGVNNRVQQATLERAWQQRAAQSLMADGVSFADPARFDLRGRLRCGRDVSIDVNVIVQGDVVLGDRVHVGPNTVLRDVHIGDDVLILENCVLEGASIGPGSRIGPFARLRPGADLVGQAHIGNFVEVKKSTIGLGSKVNHLSYVGDSTVGSGVNLGAGTITCNYDGANKHQTVIGDRAFIGSNTALVAPVTIGEGATIGAGSVIGKDAPAEKLTVGRARQVTIDGWQRPQKHKPKE
jgi:bifunctional UDP-N-acetylglucosamine pyrophosphorylase/glucosamine-1-phosphate N-acetyltransferase